MIDRALVRVPDDPRRTVSIQRCALCEEMSVRRDAS